jgi:hypothetical protein
MHLRQVSQSHNGRTYRYAQLVQSFRRPDGKPAVRIVKHLGRLPDDVYNALHTALQASHLGQTLVLHSTVADLLSGSTLANLRYLDIAVLIETWRNRHLDRILDQLAGPSDSILPFSHMVLALVLQRCCCPDSKLAATRWVPNTAVPELLGFLPSTFHNTRVHRTLDQLFQIIEPLQQHLTAACLARNGRFQALFMDVTDTWFEGIGAPMAELTRTKTDMPNKRCLGIVMLVNEHGLPLRWEVVGGKTKDWTAMRQMLRNIGKVSWLGRTLIVFDRAMGNRSTVAELKDHGLHFLTAAHRSAIESYTTALPVDAFAHVALEGTDDSYEDDIARVADAARKAGLAEIHERLFACDLGVRVPHYDEQKTPSAKRRRRSTIPSNEPNLPLGPLRMVAYFNPQLFVDMRRRTTEHCVQLQRRCDELNNELAHCKRSRDCQSTFRKFSREVERLNYLDVFDIRLEPIPVTSTNGLQLDSFRGRIERKDEVWAKRRRHDGFVLLLGHPDLPQSAVELVDSYRGKDVVEKGFQSIKSVTALRPLYHYRDPKVQAHVTLCMLALLLMRSLEQRFRDAGTTMSAPACIESLAPVHLNLRAPVQGQPCYDITRPNAAQHNILATLGLCDLANNKEVRPRLTPRPDIV